MALDSAPVELEIPSGAVEEDTIFEVEEVLSPGARGQQRMVGPDETEGAAGAPAKDANIPPASKPVETATPAPSATPASGAPLPAATPQDIPSGPGPGSPAPDVTAAPPTAGPTVPSSTPVPSGPTPQSDVPTAVVTSTSAVGTPTVSTGTPTVTATATVVSTGTPAATVVSTGMPTATATVTVVSTSTPTATATAEATATPTPGATAVPAAAPPDAGPAMPSGQVLMSFRLTASGAQTGASRRQFRNEMTIKVHYGQLGAAPDLQLSLAWWDEATQRWEQLPSEQDTDRMTLSARTNHFTVFGVTASPDLWLHEAHTTVNLVAFHSMDGTVGSLGTAATITGSIPGTNSDFALSHSADTVSRFVSGTVDAGKQLRLEGTWNFNVWVTLPSTGKDYAVKAVIYKVDAAGVATAVHTGLLASAMTRMDSSPFNISWNGTVSVGANTTLYAGERVAVAFWANSEDVGSGTFSLLYDTSTRASRIRAPRFDEAMPGVVKQNRFRIGQDSALNAMTWYSDTNIRALNMPRATNFRVRFQVYNDSTASNRDWRPRLEYSTSQTTGYAAVPLTSGTAPFFVTDTLAFTNGAMIVAPDYLGLGASPGTAANGVAYDTVNPPASNITLAAATYTEIEFNIRANTNAAYDGIYYFRMTDNGTALDSYGIYGSIQMTSAPGTYQAHYRIGQNTALDNMAWYAAADSVAQLQRNLNFRVRLQIFNSSGSTYTWSPRLEWKPLASGSWAAVPTSSGAASFFITDTAPFDNGAMIVATDDFGLGAGIGTAVNGVAYDTQNPGASTGLGNGAYTEIEFNVQANNNATVGEQYIFRLTNNGTVLTGYQVNATVFIVDTPPATPTPGPPAHNNHQVYSADTYACAACHRVHTAKSNQALLKKAWPVHETCFTCHDGTGAPDIKTAFTTKTYTMPLLTTGNLHSLTEARLRDPSQFSGANRHVECTDCHNPHKVAQTTHQLGTNYASGPLQGMWGISVENTAAWTAPAFSTTNTVQYEYQVCFKCHSSWAYGASPPVSPGLTQQYGTSYNQTDLAKELNILNESYHPVQGTGRNPMIMGSTNYGLDNGQGSFVQGVGLSANAKLFCSDCHRSGTAGDLKGPHGSDNPFILRGTWSRSTGRNSTNALCFSCHDSAVYASSSKDTNVSRTGFSNTGNSRNLHGAMVGARNRANGDAPVVCMDCHVAIPHGYFRPHLIGFTGDGKPYVDRPYSGGLTTINSWATAGNWDFDNCGTAMDSCK